MDFNFTDDEEDIENSGPNYDKVLREATIRKPFALSNEKLQNDRYGVDTFVFNKLVWGRIKPKEDVLLRPTYVDDPYEEYGDVVDSIPRLVAKPAISPKVCDDDLPSSFASRRERILAMLTPIHDCLKKKRTRRPASETDSDEIELYEDEEDEVESLDANESEEKVSENRGESSKHSLGEQVSQRRELETCDSEPRAEKNQNDNTEKNTNAIKTTEKSGEAISTSSKKIKNNSYDIVVQPNNDIHTVTKLGASKNRKRRVADTPQKTNNRPKRKQSIVPNIDQSEDDDDETLDFFIDRRKKRKRVMSSSESEPELTTKTNPKQRHEPEPSPEKDHKSEQDPNREVVHEHNSKPKSKPVLERGSKYKSRTKVKLESKPAKRSEQKPKVPATPLSSSITTLKSKSNVKSTAVVSSDEDDDKTLDLFIDRRKKRKRVESSSESE